MNLGSSGIFTTASATHPRQQEQQRHRGLTQTLADFRRPLLAALRPGTLQMELSRSTERSALCPPVSASVGADAVDPASSCLNAGDRS